jgi:Tfp pilus assembly protein PilF
VWQSAVVAALFAWHPLRVESVAWAAERKDVLSTLFWMLTLGAYWLYVRRPGWGRYLPVCLFLGLGLLAKPMLVTLPCVLLLLDYWPLGRLRLGCGRPGFPLDGTGKGRTSPTPVRAWGELLWEKIPLFALSAAFCLSTMYAQRKEGAVQTLSELPLEYRLANAAVACAGYVVKMLAPVDLAVFYPHPHGALPPGQVAGAAVFVGAVTVLALAGVRRWPYLPVGWFWYVGTLVPVVGLVQVGNQAMADRYTYVPLIGIFIAVAWGVPDLLARFPARELLLVPVTSIALVFCLLLTWVQVGFWYDSLSLWLHAKDATNDNYVALGSLARLYSARGEFDEALAHFQEALRLEPRDVLLHNNFGWLLVLQGGDGEEAYRQFDSAFRLDSHFAVARVGMGVSLLLQGKANAAAEQFIEALRSNPQDARAYNGLGEARQQQGDLKEAVDSYLRAVQLAPDAAPYHRNLAGALYDLGRIEEARREFQAAARLDPSGLRAASEQARRLATHAGASRRNGREAVRLARQILQARGEERPEDLDVLAAALAESRQFEQAAATQRRALEQASLTRPELVPAMEERLRLYQQDRPYRDSPQ